MAVLAASCTVLPVRQRVVFKVARLVYQSLFGHAPGYLVDDCQLVSDVRIRQMRSADTRTLSTGRPAISETGPSQLLEPECGTVCRQT